MLVLENKVDWIWCRPAGDHHRDNERWCMRWSTWCHCLAPISWFTRWMLCSVGWKRICIHRLGQPTATLIFEKVLVFFFPFRILFFLKIESYSQNGCGWQKYHYRYPIYIFPSSCQAQIMKLVQPKMMTKTKMHNLSVYMSQVWVFKHALKTKVNIYLWSLIYSRKFSNIQRNI